MTSQRGTSEQVTNQPGPREPSTSQSQADARRAPGGWGGRREDRPLLTGRASYISGLSDPLLDGALHGVFVRSIEARARLRSVDVDEARTAEGVAAVFLGEDVDAWPLPPRLPSMNGDLWRWLLARDEVRFVGEPIALVLAETLEQAVDAAELVFVDYEPLPPVVDIHEAASDETLIHERATTNVALAWELPPVPSEVWDDCDVVVEFTQRHPRLAPSPIEPLAGACAWHEGVTPEGVSMLRCTAWVCSQRPAGARYVIETLLGLPDDTVRAITPAVGGGFGAKGGWGCYPEDVVAVFASRAVGRPVRWTETRSEASVAMGHGRASSHRMKIGGRRDGTILAYEVEALQDSGAYPAMGTNTTGHLRNSGTGVYAIPNASAKARSVVTNTTPTVAFRGAGRPEAASDIERAVDRFAREIGQDPVEVRRRNLIPPFADGHTNALGASYDSGNYGGALDRALEVANYRELRAEQAARRQEAGTTQTRQLGIGVACTVESSGGGPGETSTASVGEDGRFTVVVGTSSHGQGHETTFAALVAEALGVDPDDVDIVHSDTDVSKFGGGTTGSRSTQLGGSAARGATVELIEQARLKAADELEANAGDVVYEPSRQSFHVVGTPTRGVAWADIGPMSVEYAFQPPDKRSSFPFGASVCAVEVDVETGEVDIRTLVAVDDAGTVLQPVLAKGQVHGGLGLAVGAALFEEMVYSPEGVPLTSNFMDYGIPSAAELPSFECDDTQTPSPLNPLGAKGIGESGTVVGTPAIHAAVLDALSPYGVDHIDLPLLPEKIWNAVNS